MEIKNAVAVCLISLFSATLVLLIARALDRQTESRLEPQLTRIAEELQAIRKSGGLPAASGDNASSEPVENGLIVYYFHGNVRCPTCQSIESQSHNTLQADFAPQVKSREVVWKILNYEEPSVAPLAKKFAIQTPVVVLAKMKGGQIETWKRLDQVWALVGDKTAFARYVHDEIAKLLEIPKAPPEKPSQGDAPAIPIPDNDTTSIPVSESSDAAPVPR